MSTESEREMLQDVIIASPPPMEDFCIEGISSPGAMPLDFCGDDDDTAVFFLDSLDPDLPSFSPAACSASAATTSAASTATSSEGPCCYVDDSAAASFALLNCQPRPQLDTIPNAAAMYHVPLAPIYNQDHFQAQAISSPFVPDGLAVQISAGPPAQQPAPEYGEYPVPLPPMPGYTGWDPPPPCPFPAAGGHYPDAMGVGFFSKAMMTGLEREMVADGGAAAMPEDVQRVYSSGDVQQMMGDCQSLVGVCNNCSSTKPLPTTDISALDNVCRLTAEQRKEKIHRYLKKRNERNFSKKIKYACRKTLADNRPRVRGRFAKNDELGEAKIRAGSNNHEYDVYEVGVKEDLDVLSPDPSIYQWCDLLEVQLQS